MKVARTKYLLSFVSFICLVSCSPSRFVKPLAKKQHAAGLSLGGPLFKYVKTTIPMPFLTGIYGYGIDSTLTGFISVNITSALYGNLQLEPGCTKQVLRQHGYWPAISVSPVFTILYRNKNTFRLYPQADVNAVWEYGKSKNYFYAGSNNWFEPSGKRSLKQRQTNHWLFTPMAGHSFNGNKWNLNLEVKVIAPNRSNQKLVVEYQTPFGTHGAFGVYIGYTRKF